MGVEGDAIAFQRDRFARLQPKNTKHALGFKDLHPTNVRSSAQLDTLGLDVGYVVGL